MNLNSTKDIEKLLSQVGKVEPVKVVAKNIARSIIEQFDLPVPNMSSETNTHKALEEAFVRGANWQRMKENKQNTELLATISELEDTVKQKDREFQNLNNKAREKVSELVSKLKGQNEKK